MAATRSHQGGRQRLEEAAPLLADVIGQEGASGAPVQHLLRPNCAAPAACTAWLSLASPSSERRCISPYTGRLTRLYALGCPPHSGEKAAIRLHGGPPLTITPSTTPPTVRPVRWSPARGFKHPGTSPARCSPLPFLPPALCTLRFLLLLIHNYVQPSAVSCLTARHARRYTLDIMSTQIVRKHNHHHIGTLERSARW